MGQVSMRSLSSLLDAMAEVDLAVLGDAVLDAWLSGSSERLCREAPVPAVNVEHRAARPGGAANTAANAAALGARVRFAAVVGGDDDGRALRDALGESGVSPDDLVVDSGRRTTAKRRVVVGDQMLARLDDADNRPLARPLQDLFTARMERLCRAADAVLVADYGLGALTQPARQRLAARRPDRPLLVVDAHDLRPWRPVRPTAVTPNWEEARELLGPLVDEVGEPSDRADFVERHAGELFAATRARLVVVTLDRDGAVLLEPDRPAHRAYVQPVAQARTTGAGDSFAAAFTLALAAGADPTSALEVAVAAATVVVNGVGTQVCDLAALRGWLGLAERSVLSSAELAAAVGRHRQAGRRVVFTNGCFDVLHRGHISYLNEAKRHGDVLVVALNGDRSVRALKGPDRPVNAVEDRAAVLAALSCVDHIAVFDEDSPRKLLEVVRPDVYVKGGDYTPEMLPETPLVRRLGGEVRILGYLADHSSTRIIERIRATSGAGPDALPARPVP
jgi:rfaE bifunctional protein kinase chain/domain/rfaE bifunctional protein nucleotidyltransferase chain/domain